MNLFPRPAVCGADLRPFRSRGYIGNITIGYSLERTVRRTTRNKYYNTFVGRGTRVERDFAAARRAQTNPSAVTRYFEDDTAGHLPAWRGNTIRVTSVCNDKTTDSFFRDFHRECLTKRGYGGRVPLQHGLADFGCLRTLQTCKRSEFLSRMWVVNSQLQRRRGAFDFVAAVHPSLWSDAEQMPPQHISKTHEAGKGAALLTTFHQLEASTAHVKVRTSPSDPAQPPLARPLPHSDSQTERRDYSNPIPALTIAAAAFFACPLEWGRNSDASREDENNNDSGTDEAGDGCAAYYHRIDCGCEDMNCLTQGAYPWRPVLHAATLIGRGLEGLQLYFSRLMEQLGGANGSVSVGSLQSEDAALHPWFVWQYCIKNVCCAINQAFGVVRLHKKKYNSAISETTHNIHPAQGYPSSGERTVVVEKHAGGKYNLCVPGQKLDPHCDNSYQRDLVGRVAGPAECSSGVQFNPQRPKLFESNAQNNMTDAIPKACGWLTASYRALASFFRTIGSVLLRLLYVVPLGFTAAAAGFWLLGLTYLSACLRAVGLGGRRLLQLENTARRELEEVIFTAVTAAASAAGPTYVKFLQWIATRPDLFHESLCSRCARLQTSVTPFSFPRAALLLREQFGDDVGRHLLLDPTPIGCGCIAQVYRAYLLLSNEASEESKRAFLDRAFVLGGSLSKSAASELSSGNKLPPVAVAVKIMRPGVREAMEFDLRMMLLIASVLEYLPAFGFVALKKSVEEFAAAMRRQLDFGLEEEHLKRFRSNFGLSTTPIPNDLLPLRNRRRRPSDPRQCGAQTLESKAERHHTNILGSLSRKILGMRCQVTFPYPFEALSSSEVIVMTLESGFTLNQLFRARAELQELEGSSHYQRSCRGNRGLVMTKRERGDTLLAFPSPAAQNMIERFSNVGMTCLHSFLQMVFLDNFFHGDMHSGNLLCRFAHKNKELIFPVLPSTMPTLLRTHAPQLDGPLELVVLDCGLAGSLDQADRVNFVTLLEAIARKRGREAALAMLERAKRSSCQDKEGFCSEVEQLIVKHHFEEGNSLQMSNVRLTSLMGHMLSVSKKYCVELDPSFVSIVVAMSVLEGVGAQLCPDADVLRTALPYSLMAAKLLNPEGSREA